MIISRSPLRISLGGGGTDLPSYYEKNEGFVLAAAIDKYVYVSANRPFEEGIKLKYSIVENQKNITSVQHPIIREVLSYFELETPQIELGIMADIPAGTGLGSSGSFTVSLIQALSVHYRKNLSRIEIAEIACRIEIETLGEPIGKQDQYIAATGGIMEFVFKRDGEVKATPLGLTFETLQDLEDNLLLFFTGLSRSASTILADQDQKSKLDDASMIDGLHYIKDLGHRSKEALLSEDTVSFGKLLNEHWERKKLRSSGITNNSINRAYERALENGAIGGKLVGAGGGGFLMFYASERKKLRKEMRELGMQEVRFRFDFEGTKVILS
jgi:D-glycero-alpha-D-manno-heptose-7-phosphate kinase